MAQNKTVTIEKKDMPPGWTEAVKIHMVVRDITYAQAVVELVEPQIGTGEFISNEVLQSLNFKRITPNLDTEWDHIKLGVINMKLSYFDGSYSFIHREGMQGLGRMRRVPELLYGFKFLAGGHPLSGPNHRPL